MMWRSIDGYEGIYEVSDSGIVRSVPREVFGKVDFRYASGRILRPHINQWGYECVSLCRENKATHKFVHRLVAEAFIPNPGNRMEVNHKDGDKRNNSVDNLEWATRSENQKHAFDSGLHSRMTPVKILETGEVFPSIAEAARSVNGKTSGINRCLAGRRRTHRNLHFVRAEGEPHD